MKSEDTPIQNENTQHGSGDMPDPGELKHDIPKFDLAEQILAGQRKFSSIKRKAPVKNRIGNRDRNSVGNNNNIQSDNSIPILNPIPEPVPMNDVSCDKIISEIVARDIRDIRSRCITG